MPDPLPRPIREIAGQVTGRADEANGQLEEKATRERATETAEDVLGRGSRTAEKTAASMDERRLDRTCDDEDEVCVVAYETRDGEGVIYYGENGTYYDVDLTVDLSVFEEYVEREVPDSKRVIVPPKEGSAPGRVELIPIGQQFKSVPLPGFDASFGDPNATHTKPGYALPFPAGKEYECSQGFDNQGGTHAGEYAADFEMPTGSAVTAARRGVVVFVGRGRRDAWAVRLRHDDGTYATYAHLTTNSETVDVGDAVDVGDTLAKSGDTGQSTGPHLHFQVEKADGNDGWETIPWQLDGRNVLVDGQEPSAARVRPRAGKTYRRPE